MQTRQWMVTNEWMVKPMPQREWIIRRGILVWISEAFTSLGTGLYLVSLFLNNWWGMVAGWTIIMFLKIPVHLAYFGKPQRFYRTMPPFSNAWKTSWSARGVVFTMFFAFLALIQLVIGQPDIRAAIGPAATPAYWVFSVLAGFSAFLTSVYSGFIMNSCKTIPFWDTAILPIIIPLAGIADGFGLIMAVGLAGGNINIASAEMWGRITLVVSALVIVIYLISVGRNSQVARLSVKELIVGRVAVAFWGGLITLGIIVPLAISVSSLFTGTEASTIMLIIAITCHTIGAFSLKYCLLKVGIHRPITPEASAS
jgi:formate-dependent nitrite reductase membrane component NrfD